MLIFIVGVASVPFIIWVTLGVTFTALNWVQFIVQQERMMDEVNEDQPERAKLIRYADLKDEARPYLLSVYDKQKNIQTIDRTHASILPNDIRNRLEMCEMPCTRIINDHMGLRFGPCESQPLN